MESGIALTALGGFSKGQTTANYTKFLTGLPLMPSRRTNTLWSMKNIRRGGVVIVEAKGRKSMQEKMYKQRPPPSVPPAEDDNPRFVVFIRSKNVPRWYPLNIISGGTTAKIMVAGKDTPVGKFLYEGALTRNLAAVVYKDEKEIRKIALKQYPVLKAASELQYGYKLIDPKNPNSALYSSDIIKIPPQEELKPVVEKVKDFFGNAMTGVKESFGTISNLDTGAEEGAKNPEKEKKSEAGTTS